MKANNTTRAQGSATGSAGRRAAFSKMPRWAMAVPAIPGVMIFAVCALCFSGGGNAEVASFAPPAYMDAAVGDTVDIPADVAVDAPADVAAESVFAPAPEMDEEEFVFEADDVVDVAADADGGAGVSP